MGAFVDRTNMRYGRLLVIARNPEPASFGRRLKWKCICDCGNITEKTGHELASGDTTSCGCFHKEIVGNIARSHGQSKTSTYHIWQAMKDRCSNVNNLNYKNYGGRGISVCKRWLESYENFLEDMGYRPNLKTLDRINVNGNYEPKNCKWSTLKEQSENKRCSVLYEGKITSKKNVAELNGIPRTSLNKAMYSGMDVYQAIEYVKERMRKGPS